MCDSGRARAVALTAAGRPAGAPVAAVHFHDSMQPKFYVGALFGITPDKLYVAPAQAKDNIWVVKVDRPQEVVRLKPALPYMVLLILVAAAALVAQTITGSVTGTVTDTSGAAMPNVKVSATNVATGVGFPAQTNAAGVYSIGFLPPGAYNVSAEAAGFKKSVLGPFDLEVNQIARVDIAMEVGDFTQAVDVIAVAPILQTESTATGDTITSTKLTSLPLNGRNFASLLILIPGAITTYPPNMSTSGRFQGSGSRPQVNGNREQTNNFLLDGVDVNELANNRIAYQPNVDALEEVKVLTGNAGAEFGNVGGASVIMTLKGGTNFFHGNAFEFLRNEKLDANGFFANRSGAQRTALRRNIFGGTLGGPLRRNRAFFFIDYEGTEQRNPGPALASVAPAAWRSGDLSQFLLTLGQVVRDPLTGASLAQRQPFSGNIIPQARIINPVGHKLFSSPDLYPLPNNLGVGPLGVTNNYMSSSRDQLSNHQADAKLDWRPSNEDTVSGRWSISRYEAIPSQAALPVLLPKGTYGATTSAVANWTRAFTTRLVNDARVAFSRIRTDESLPVDWSGKLGPDGNASFGIPGGQPIPGISSIAVGDGLTNIGAAGNLYHTVENKYQAQTNFTLQSGTHLLKFGGQIIRIQQNARYAGLGGALGTFVFSGGYSGSAYGDFLLDALARKARGAVTGAWGQRHWRNAVFVQDDWKLRRNLTLNLGLRWEYISPLDEVADRQLNIDIFTGKLIYPGKSEYGRALYKPYHKQFMPTIGWAWTPDALKSKLVIRAGYRFSTFLEGTGVGARLPLNPPFFVESDITFDRTLGDIRTGFADVIAHGDLTGPRTGANPFYTGFAWEFNLRPQFTNQWNFALESQLSPATSISAAYVGQRGTHLIVARDANQPLPGTGLFNTWAPINDRRPLAGALPNVGIVGFTESGGTMNYHALQVGARRRFSRGLEFLASYTLSKTLTDDLGFFGCGGVNSQGATVQNSYNRHGDFGPACSDALHNFAVGGLYELPFGKGKRYGSTFPRALDLLLGGWSLSHSLGAHSGFPVTLLAGAFRNSTGQSAFANIRPNRYRPLAIADRTIDRWFGPAGVATFCDSGGDNGVCAYGLPALGSFGNAGVGTERAPHYFNLDSSLGKKFHVTEKKYLGFRAEFFNALNYVSLGPPGRDITSPATFGQITSQIGNPRNIQFGLKYCF